ncbi:uncharacterized protein LOC123564454 isoform X3 [Mercenaria mercenaria]|uniref:uncharacterized protein LOC123564454 isoform X3 n=1 Tax=Mercenaria mercenaria TaxID=6596 RepID=UPI00234E5B0E|nr:uncharacterized protein LOC123564454 isoform X3 [Mercenaria mercenaria]
MDNVESSLPGGNAPAHWYDTWDRQTSQSFSNAAKGLRNAPGENNCFLNSAVQVFWHIDVFRRSYRRLSGHLCMGHSCIFCALKVIFTQFQYSDQASLQPSALRKALANTFAKQERFQLGHMDDAAECFENILNRIHYHIANSYNEDACNAPHCISHQKFAMTVFDQLVCPCGATSEPLKFYEMVHYISANALVSQSRTMQESGDILHPSRFGLLLRNAGAVGDIRDCPGNCGKRVQIRRTLLNIPDVVSIGLVWGSDKADPELAAEVTRTIGTTILYPDMFHSVMCNDASQLPRLHLTSVVCYYGKHYSTFIFHTKLQEWVYFDDATVRQVGKRWEQVVERIVKSRYQPLLLIYTNQNAQPVPTETAPSTRVMAPGYSMTPGKGQEDNKGQPNLPEKAQTDSQNSRRSGTPGFNRTDSNQSEKEPLERTSSFENRRQSSFMLAVTRQKNKEEAIYAVPHNNNKIMNSQKDISQCDPRPGYVKQNSVGYLADIPDGPEDSDSYNYTLSNSDQYRRPAINVSDPHKLPLTQNFSRTAEQQRKDSFKKGKGKVAGDVIRYHVDGSRRSSQSSESDMNSSISETTNGPHVSNSKPALPVKPKNVQTRSQSVEENMSNMTDRSNSSHKVVKPLPTSAPLYDNKDSVTRAHTPVQSGLATLPRSKKSGNLPNSNSNSSMPSSSSSSSLTSMSHTQPRAGSQQMAAPHQQYSYEGPPPPYTIHSNHPVHAGYQNCLTYQNIVENDMHSRQSSSSSILSSGTVVECPVSEIDSHTRQMSTASQDTLTDKPKEQKTKSKKKDKDDKKKDESKQKKDEKKTKSKKDKSSKNSNSDKPPPVPDKKQGDEGYSEERYYIDPRMVESVLSAQKLQRSGSCVSQASTSSIESDTYNRGRGVTPKDNLSTEIPFDAASLDSHKDSGYASSDRNSSSSTGSITMNPYEQYFLSRSMIPPKTINQQNIAENMRKLMDNGSGMNGLEYTQEKDLKSLVMNSNEYYGQNQTVGHCQQMNPNYPKSGSKDIMTLPKAERDQHLIDALSGRSKAGLPPQVPPKLPQGHPHQGQGPLQQSQGPHISERNNDKGMPQNVPDTVSQPVSKLPSSFREGNEQFIALCQKAEDFMDSCVLAETSEQYGSALGFCQQAIDHLKTAMKMPNLGQSLYITAQKKSNSCVIKFRSLQKRLMARQESNTSSNSSDSGINPDYRSRSGYFGQQKSQSHLQSQSNGSKPPSRSSSQNSMDSLSSSGRSATPVFDKVMRPSTSERVPPVEPHMPPAEYHNAYKDRSFETNIPDTNTNNADLYGTLPRRKTQKSQEHVRQCNNQKHEAEVYHDFLENQRRQCGNHSRTNSGARTPVNETSPSDYPNYPHHQGQFVSNNTYDGVSRNITGQSSGTNFGQNHGIKQIPVVPPKIGNQSQHTESQPDLRKLCEEPVNIPQRPLTPQVLCPDSNEGDEHRPVSVRALTSRFESATVSSDSKTDNQSVNCVQNVNSNSHSQLGPVNSVPVDPNGTSRVTLQRQRSKSESESLAQQPQRPKSVLAKKGKNSDRLNKPRKSVTFSEDICLVSAADGSFGIMGNGNQMTYAGYQGDDKVTSQISYRKNEETDSSTSDSPVEVIGEGACTLCHKQGVEIGQNYCAKCTYYMSRFTPR